mgnify:CR=1 FL=1
MTYKHTWTAINASEGKLCDRCKQLLRERVDFIELPNGLTAQVCRCCAATIEATLIMEEV